ncbi:hypothetical protein ARAM_000823 [Aspergillus rambellii]|uniref:Tetrapyrrole biosynthesis uroporphyrinogen III synthase domain-containing protein n=1 Tax=Aspergillus rambellii TaxID=308745 RepID=A0A0F8VAL8_9EURO|nr:hypothetical protein ARAM_000823 [Aspergillus rambellii]
MNVLFILFKTEQIRKSLAPSLILYTVGPATARSLATLRDAYLPGANIFGADSGTGENLAAVMLRHYNSVYGGMGVSSEHHAEERGKQGNEAGMRKPALLFLVGEQRRDIIPKTLMGAVPERDRIRVDEVVVYQTGVVAGFEGDFEGVVRRELACCFSRSQCSSAGRHPRKTIWVVVFSPTGCDAMLKVLSREDGLVFGREPNREASERRVFVATIGPTTRDHLINEYRFAPEVCAKKPSPEGVGSGIEEFMKSWEGK